MKNVAFILLLIMLFLGGLDAIFYWTFGIDGTISRFMQLTMIHSPLFTFMCGGLFGHFMCAITEPPKNIDYSKDDNELHS